MNTGIHLGYSWLLGDAAGLDLNGRRFVAIAGIAADIDGLSIALGREAFDTYHHIVLHNLVFVAVITVAVLILFPGKLRLLLFTALAGLLHLIIDFTASHWDLELFRPFSSASLNLTRHLPEWLVIYVFQGAGTLLMFVLVFYVFLKKERSFIEILTPKGDKLLMNFIILPWRNRCACGKRAFYQCGSCGTRLCTKHRTVGRDWQLLCENCLDKTTGVLDSLDKSIKPGDSQ